MLPHTFESKGAAKFYMAHLQLVIFVLHILTKVNIYCHINYFNHFCKLFGTI